MLMLKDGPEVPSMGDCPSCAAPIQLDFVWTPKALTDWLGLESRETLRKWDKKGIGPRIQRLPSSNRIRYRHSDVMAWLDDLNAQHEEASEDAPAAPQDSPAPRPTFSMTDGKTAVRSNG